MLRKDGLSTRKRILDAALVIFGEKGYRDATTAEVCQAARANCAAVNYHFRSKEQLYRDVCAHAIAAMAERYPPEGNVSEAAPPEDRLFGHIDAVIRRSRVKGPLRHYHSLRMMETFHPTGLVDDLWNSWFGRHRELSAAIIGEMLGPEATADEVLRCQMSLMSQCYIANSSAVTGRFHNLDATHLCNTETVVDHIYCFTRAGVEAIRREIEQRTSKICQ